MSSLADGLQSLCSLNKSHNHLQLVHLLGPKMPLNNIY
uniref:Uncharacterized protein n=1 Tax=Manihot esculenta TaxID=3983 RepID=A0A2C9UDC2_MANES